MTIPSNPDFLCPTCKSYDTYQQDCDPVPDGRNQRLHCNHCGHDHYRVKPGTAVETTSMKNREFRTYEPRQIVNAIETFNSLSKVPEEPIDLGDGREARILSWVPVGEPLSIGILHVSTVIQVRPKMKVNFKTTVMARIGAVELRDLDTVKEFFDNFDYKKEFSTAIIEMLRNDAFFCLPRTDMKNIVLQELPASPQYSMITGRWDYGLLFSFNFLWFLLPGVDISMYPSFFKRKYNEIWKDNVNKYNPSMPPETRGLSSWVYFQDIPVDVGWVFKFGSNLATRLPYFTGLFLDLYYQPLIRSLQKNSYMSAANRMVFGEIGTLKEAQAKEKDQFNISPRLL